MHFGLIQADLTHHKIHHFHVSLQIYAHLDLVMTIRFIEFYPQYLLKQKLNSNY